MPPAFNLSQDQTLQFDLAKLFPTHLTRTATPLDEKTRHHGRSPSPVAQRIAPTALASCEHQCLGTPDRPVPPAHPGPTTPAPTPIDCKLLKSRQLKTRAPPIGGMSDLHPQRSAIIQRFWVWSTGGASRRSISGCREHGRRCEAETDGQREKKPCRAGLLAMRPL